MWLNETRCLLFLSAERHFAMLLQSGSSLRKESSNVGVHMIRHAMLIPMFTGRTGSGSGNLEVFREFKRAHGLL